jgi:hypothetical protein
LITIYFGSLAYAILTDEYDLKETFVYIDPAIPGTGNAFTGIAARTGGRTG